MRCAHERVGKSKIKGEINSSIKNLRRNTAEITWIQYMPYHIYGFIQLGINNY